MANDIDLPTSPVPDLLDGNCVALPSQTHMIYDTVSVAQADISRLDGEILRLQAVLDGLVSKREALHTYTRLHMGLVAPARHLLPEILSEIFLQCKKNEGYEDRPRLDRAPLLLGSVCRRWRTIALSTPWLWASFALTITKNYWKSDVLLAKTWLSRAGTCPLSIALGGGDGGFAFDDDGFALGGGGSAPGGSGFENGIQPLMQVFLLHCERWYDVQLYLHSDVLRSLSPAKNRLQMLQKLHVNDTMDETVDIFECAPQLRCFNLSYHSRSSMIKVPWNQLQHFDMGSKDIDSCLELLRLTPHLKSCRVWLYGPAPRQSTSQVQHLHLCSIHADGDLVHLYDMLRPPKLHEISIDILGLEWGETPQLVSFLSLSSPKIFFFKARSHHPCDDDMIQILQACPSLVQLELRQCIPQCMTKHFLAQFASHGGSGNSSVQLVPKLHTLIVDYHPSFFNIFDFADAIESRMMLGGELKGLASDNLLVAELKTVEIHLRDMQGEPLDTTILSRLHQLRDNGLRISVREWDKIWL
jgi:hypothetical protein